MEDNLVAELIFVWIGIGLLVCAGALFYLIILILQLQTMLQTLRPPQVPRDSHGKRIHERV